MDTSKENKKPFPSINEFREWYNNYWYSNDDYGYHELYAYFAQFQYERVVFPKVGDMVEGETFNGYKIVGRLTSFYVCSDEALHVNTIRPVTRPTREEVIKSINNKLENGTDKIIFDRELVEQFLKILKG